MKTKEVAFILLVVFLSTGCHRKMVPVGSWVLLYSEQHNQEILDLRDSLPKIDYKYPAINHRPPIRMYKKNEYTFRWHTKSPFAWISDYKERYPDWSYVIIHKSKKSKRYKSID